MAVPKKRRSLRIRRMRKFTKFVNIFLSKLGRKKSSVNKVYLGG